MAKESREHLWQIITPLIVAAILGAASLVVAIGKLAYTSIADPYAGNIYWEPSLKHPFGQTGRCFFTAYRIVNRSSQPTKHDITFDFQIYKPAGVNFVPTPWPRSFQSKRPSSPSTVPETKVILMSSSEVDMQFEVFTDSVSPWDGDQTFEGWLRIIAHLRPAIPADDAIDIVRLYWSYSPIDTVKSGSELLTIASVLYPNADTNKKTLVQKKLLIANQKEALISYWILFLLLLALTFIAGGLFIKAYTQHRSKLKHQEEQLAKIRRKEQDEQRTLKSEHERESRLEQEFAVTETDEEAMNGGRQRPPENNITPPAAQPNDSGDKKT